LHLVSLLSTLFVAMTVIPVFGLTQRLTDSRTAWRAAALTITVPAIGVFVPRSDVLYACSGMILAWVVVGAMLTDRRSVRWPLAILSGIVMFGCLLLSLAHLPVLVMLALFVAGFSLVDLKNRIGQTLETTLVAGVSFFIVCGFWKYSTHCDLLNAWQMNLTNHASFYATSPRSSWAWFAANPLELAMAVGLPMTAMAVVMVLQSFKSIRHSPHAGRTNGRILAFACTLTWVLLWLSGKNNGEAARLWCFVTPWVAMIAAQVGAADPGHADPAAVANRNWLPLLMAQLIIATVTVGRVSGFLEF
ncbi:MAG: hypothetical protein O2856_07355, partial [Planctomycetota bacterium]|nr:hypothetical protein [Planctomycetota bacterium]